MTSFFFESSYFHFWATNINSSLRFSSIIHFHYDESDVVKTSLIIVLLIKLMLVGRFEIFDRFSLVPFWNLLFIQFQTVRAPLVWIYPSRFTVICLYSIAITPVECVNPKNCILVSQLYIFKTTEKIVVYKYEGCLVRKNIHLHYYSKMVAMYRNLSTPLHSTEKTL